MDHPGAGVHVGAHLSQHAQHGDVGLAGACRAAGSVQSAHAHRPRKATSAVPGSTSLAAALPGSPVGAQTSMFSLEVKAVWKMRDWMRFSVLYPAKASCAHSGSASICGGSKAPGTRSRTRRRRVERATAGWGLRHAGSLAAHGVRRAAAQPGQACPGGTLRKRAAALRTLTSSSPGGGAAGLTAGTSTSSYPL